MKPDSVTFKLKHQQFVGILKEELNVLTGLDLVPKFIVQEGSNLALVTLSECKITDTEAKTMEKLGLLYKYDYQMTKGLINSIFESKFGGATVNHVKYSEDGTRVETAEVLIHVSFDEYINSQDKIEKIKLKQYGKPELI